MLMTLSERKYPGLHTQSSTLSETELEVVCGGHARHEPTDEAMGVTEKVLALQFVHAEDCSAA